MSLVCNLLEEAVAYAFGIAFEEKRMKKRMKKRMVFFAAGVLSAALCLSVLAGCTDLSLSDSKESANSVMGGVIMVL